MTVAADDRQNLAGDIAGTARRGEEHIGRRDFLRLRRADHLRLGAETLHLFSWAVGGIEWRPDRPRRDGIDADATRYQVDASDRVKAWMPPLVIE